MTKTIDQAILRQLKDLVGSNGWIESPAEIAPYLKEERGFYQSFTPLVLRPASTAEVSAVLRLCYKTRTPVVPQGGNTGLVGGTVAGLDQQEIILNMGRLKRFRTVTPLDELMIVEAGLTLSKIQDKAASVDKLFPLSLASEGSCQIGGNLATNAGGTAVLRYGNTRDLVLGLEVVLADGSVWNGLNLLRKDNSSYDFKHLFLGSEGTLGVITAAALKLFPAPNNTATVMLAVPNISSALKLLSQLREDCGEAISAFEFFEHFALDLVLRHIPDIPRPLEKNYKWYVLVDARTSANALPLREAMEQSLSKAMQRGLVLDAIVASSGSQAESLWKIRETIPEAQKFEGASIKHDISVPATRVASFVEEATRSVLSLVPDSRPCVFGHLGDGNIHFNITRPRKFSDEAFFDFTQRINSTVYEIAHEKAGSISAEHGIGRLKRLDIQKYKSATELTLMRNIKNTLDPRGILNPGKVL